MAAENSPEIHKRRDQLADIAKSRETLLGRIGVDSELKYGVSDAIDNRIVNVRRRVLRSRERVADALARVEDLVAAVDIASEYEAMLEQKTAVISNLRQGAEEGIYPHDLLKKREEEYSSFQQQPDNDPDLKLGLEMLREQRERAVATAKDEQKVDAPPASDHDSNGEEGAERERQTLKINLASRFIQIDGLSRSFREGTSWEVFLHLAINSDRPVSTGEIKEIVEATGGVSSSGGVISGLRQAIGNESIETTYIGEPGAKNAAYKLNAEVEFDGLFVIDPEEVDLTESEERLLHILRFGNVDDPIARSYASKFVYGADIEPSESQTEFTELLSSLKEKIKDIGVDVLPGTTKRKEPGHYLFEYIEKSQGAEQDSTNLGTAEGLQAPRSTGSKPSRVTYRSTTIQTPRYGVPVDGARILEFKADAREWIMPEEKAALAAIINGLNSNSRLWWNRLVPAISPYFPPIPGTDVSEPLTAAKIYSAFVKGLDKMIEEHRLGIEWSEEDRKLWSHFEYKKETWANDQLGIYKRKIRAELDKRERDHVESQS